VDPNVVDDYGYTPLLEATWNGHDACIQTLVESGANPNVVNDYGNTPLYQASWNGHEACVRVLLAAGADPNVVDYYGSTPLHPAASEGHESCVRELLASGADPNVADKTGETPLQCAVRQERTGCVKILIIRILTDRSLTDAEWDLITTVMNIGYLLPIVLARYGRDAAAKLVSRLPEDKRKVLETVAMCLSRFVSRDLIEPILVRCA
jgi:cytohesin